MHMYFCSTIYSAHILERRFEKIKWEKCYHSSGFQPRLNKQSTEHFRRMWCYWPNEKSLYAGFTTRKTNIQKWEQFKSRHFHESYDMTPYSDMNSWIKESVSRLQLLEWLTVGAKFSHWNEIFCQTDSYGRSLVGEACGKCFRRFLHIMGFPIPIPLSQSIK